jgi:hypothetical protein
MEFSGLRNLDNFLFCLLLRLIIQLRIRGLLMNDDRWTFGRKRLLTNRVSIHTFGWRDWQKPRNSRCRGPSRSPERCRCSCPLGDTDDYTRDMTARQVDVRREEGCRQPARTKPHRNDSWVLWRAMNTRRFPRGTGVLLCYHHVLALALWAEEQTVHLTPCCLVALPRKPPPVSQPNLHVHCCCEETAASIFRITRITFVLILTSQLCIGTWATDFASHVVSVISLMLRHHKVVTYVNTSSLENY